MALTKDQWFAKLKSWVPSWFFEEERRNVAVFQGVARVFANAQKNVEDVAAETFITKADGVYLDMHGDEREIERIADESDVLYSPRVQRIVSQTDRPDILALANSLLSIKPAEIREPVRDSAFFGREQFMDRYQYWDGFPMNAFLIVTPPQTHLPYAFNNRQNFLGRADFMGSESSADEVYASLIAAIDSVKAFGVLYRIVEKSH